ncbi:MAG: hypothetical protein IKU46_06485 [Peptococcaceae bacterium]|nr:hypothetical protein [Peptococcaceae bacterium]
MFRPNQYVTHCPICGAPLHHETIYQFEVPVGYSTHCADCCNYSDIWVSGLREVQCGTWTSPDYESDYGSLTVREKWLAFQVLCKLNLQLMLEKAEYIVKQAREPKMKGKHAHA